MTHVEFTRDDIVTAMQKVVDEQSSFQTWDVINAGADAVPFDCPGWDRHGFFQGESMACIADKLLQENRDACRIEFKKGFWWHTKKGDRL